MRNVYVVTGANSGLGKCIVRALEALGPPHIVLKVYGPGADAKDEMLEISADLTNEFGSVTVSQWVKSWTNDLTMVDEEYYPILVNCAGMNYIEWFDQADFSMFDRLMGLNVKAGLMLAQNLIGFKPPVTLQDAVDWFNGRGAIVNIVSNASHVPMTNSAFYNASKGAFHIATLALARELRKTHGICIFGISPNKLRGTGMSSYIEGRVPDLRGWTPEQAMQYQLAALPAGDETDPEVLADFIAYLLSEPRNHKYLTNTVIPYGA